MKSTRAAVLGVGIALTVAALGAGAAWGQAGAACHLS